MSILAGRVDIINSTLGKAGAASISLKSVCFKRCCFIFTNSSDCSAALRRLVAQQACAQRHTKVVTYCNAFRPRLFRRWLHYRSQGAKGNFLLGVMVNSCWLLRLVLIPLALSGANWPWGRHCCKNTAHISKLMQCSRCLLTFWEIKQGRAL